MVVLALEVSLGLNCKKYLYFSSHRSHNCDRSVQPNSQNPIKKNKKMQLNAS